MQPNQPVGSPAPGSNPYEFITNPGKPPKKQLFGGGGSLTKRLIIVVGGAVALMILLAIGTSLLTSGGSGNVSALKTMVAQQQELARIAAIGAERAQDSSIRAQALTTKLSVTTQQQKLTSYLASRDVKLNEQELIIKLNKDTDKALDAAASSNRFDQAFQEELTKQLNSYAVALQDAYKSTSNEKGKAVLSESFNSTAFILGLK